MEDIAVLSRKNGQDSHYIDPDTFTVFKDTWLEIQTRGKLARESIFVSQEIVCILFGKVHGYDSAALFASSYLMPGSIDLASLDGHFLLVIYNPIECILHIYRDLAGFQHAYYCFEGDDFVISTSLRWTLNLCSQRQDHAVQRPSRPGLAYYCIFQYLPSPYTFFEQVLQLAPGHVFHAKRGKQLQLAPYVFFPPIEPAILENSFEEHVLTIQDMLYQSTLSQIKTGQDVVAFLSGGMDTSTNIALLVEKFGIKPTALTATFQEKAYDELASAQIVAEKFGLEHLIVPITPELIHELPAIVTLYENPHGDRSIFAEYFLCSAAQARGFKQLVTGEGGDEILGYPRTRDGNQRLDALPSSPQELAIFYLNLTSASPQTIWQKLVEPLHVDQNCGYAYLEALYHQYNRYDPFEQLYFGQWRTWLIDGVYMKDNSMARHFELQPVMPFMDSLLMRHVSQIPVAMKRSGLADKTFLKTAMKTVLPEQILSKPKHKFWLPFAEWFRTSLYDYLHETLLQTNSFVCNHYSRATISQLIEAHRLSHEDHSRTLWNLLFLEVWYHEFAQQWM